MTVSPVVYESRAYGAIPIVRTAHFKTRDGRPTPVARDRHRGEIRNLLGGGGRLIMYGSPKCDFHGCEKHQPAPVLETPASRA